MSILVGSVLFIFSFSFLFWWVPCCSSLALVFYFILLFCLYSLCVFCTMLPVSSAQCCLCLLHNVACVFCTMLPVSSAQCCLCLLHNVACVFCTMLPVSSAQCYMCLLHNVACVFCTMLPVSSAQCCLCLLHNVACVSALSILDCPLVFSNVY